MKKQVLVVAFLISSIFGFSQTISYDASVNYGTVEAASGTYQIMTTQPKVQELFTNHLLYFIEANRDINKTVTQQIGEYTYVKILAKNYISNPNYSRLSDEIMAVDYNDIFPIVELETKTK